MHTCMTIGLNVCLLANNHHHIIPFQLNNYASVGKLRLTQYTMITTTLQTC